MLTPEQAVPDKFAWFWAKVARGEPDQCWPWVGFKKKSGHGLTAYKSCSMHASRLAWIITHGPIERDLCVNHRCDEAACCNPAHLYLGTRRDNMIDLWERTPPEKRGERGRPYVLTVEQVVELLELRRNGATLKDCAQKFGVHIATVCRIVTEQRKEKLRRIYADRLSRSQK